MKKFLLAFLLIILVSLAGFFFYAFSRLDYSDLNADYTLKEIIDVREGDLTVQWLGNTNVVVSDGKHTIMTDGWFTRESINVFDPVIEVDVDTVKSSLKKANIENLVAVIPIHSHFDHVMDAPQVSQETGAILMGSHSSANVARGWDLPEEQIYEVEQEGSLTLGEFKVTMIKTQHYIFPRRPEITEEQVIESPPDFPISMFAYEEGGAYAVWIEHPKGNILINGSAGFVPGALDRVKADIVFLGVAGVVLQTTEYQQQYWDEVVETSGAKVVIPIHWDSLTHPLTDTPQPPTRLLNDLLLLVKMKESVLWLMDKKEVYTPILPMWVKVPVRQLNQEAE